jgi:hypothetical protein
MQTEEKKKKKKKTISAKLHTKPAMYPSTFFLSNSIPLVAISYEKQTNKHTFNIEPNKRDNANEITP